MIQELIRKLMIESVSWRVYVLRGIGIVGGMLEIITFLGRDLIDDSLSDDLQ